MLNRDDQRRNPRADPSSVFTRTLEDRHDRPESLESIPMLFATPLSRTASTALRRCAPASPIPICLSSARLWNSIPASRHAHLSRCFAIVAIRAASFSCAASWPFCVPGEPEPFLRLHMFPAEQAQVDWAHFGEVAVGRARRRSVLFCDHPVLVASVVSGVFLRPDAWRTSCAAMCTPFKPGRVFRSVILHDNFAVRCWSGAAIRSTSIPA